MTRQQIKLGRPTLYPWKEWLKPGTTTMLEKGRDFDCETHSLVLLIRRKVTHSRLNVRVSVRHLTVKIEIE